MIIEFDKSFEKSIGKIKNKSLFPRIEKIIIEFENATEAQKVRIPKRLNDLNL